MNVALRDELREAAVAYRRLPWWVIPDQLGGKIPADGIGWQTDAFARTVEQVADHWSRPFNVGVVLGSASGDLVDVDLDCAEALALADNELPAGAWVFGRASTPRAHRLYRAPGVQTLQFRDVKPANAKAGKMMVELRGTPPNGRHQTVLPPSIHTSGEKIEWDPEYADALPLPALVAPAALVASVRRLAVKVCIARHLPGGIQAARACSFVPERDALPIEVIAHCRDLAGGTGIALPAADELTPPRAVRTSAHRGTSASMSNPLGRLRAAGVHVAADLVGIGWDERRHALELCPACGADTRSTHDKRPPANVFTGTDGIELWTHHRCGTTGDAVSLAGAALLGTTNLKGRGRELITKLNEVGWA